MSYKEYYRGHAVSSGGPGEHGAKDVVQGRGRSIATAIGSVLCTAFLPEGYPESVTSDYISEPCLRPACDGWDQVPLSGHFPGHLNLLSCL